MGRRLPRPGSRRRKENGESVHPHTFSQSFERLLAQAGLRTIRLHDLRHTHASLALKTGVPVKAVSERLGHESPAFTLKRTRTCCPECGPRRQGRSQHSSPRKPRLMLRELAGVRPIRPDSMGTYVRNLRVDREPVCVPTTRNQCNPGGQLTSQP